MADGEGVVEEVLVKGRYDGTEIEKGIPASVEKGVAGAKKPIQDFAAETAKIYKGMTLAEIQKQISVWKGTKRPIEDVISSLKDLGMTNEEIRAGLVEAGYVTKQFGKALGDMGGAVKKTNWDFASMAKSIEFAAYRFITALAIYMLFRKVIRTINEAITESIRLFKELVTAQRTLGANIEINTRIVGEAVGVLKDWNEWIAQTAQTWKTTRQSVIDASNTVLQANTTLRLSGQELQDIIKLGRAVAVMWTYYKDGQLDVAKGTDVVINAMQGQQAAMSQLGFTLDDVVKYFNEISDSVHITAQEFKDLPDAMQQSIIRAYLMAERFDDIDASAREAISGVDAFGSTLDAMLQEQKTGMGEFATVLTNIPKLFEGGILGLAEATGSFIDKLIKLRDTSIEVKGALLALGLAFFGPMLPGILLWIEGAGRLQEFLKGLMDRAKAAVTVTSGLSDATEDSGEKAISAAAAWQRFTDAADHAGTVAEKAKRILDAVRGIQQKVKDAVDKTAQAFVDLGEAIADAIMESDRAKTQAGIDYWKDYNETLEDQKKDELKLEERYADKADDLRKRAADKIADLRKRATEDEERDRADLLLRLHQMEEDYQLSMKQLYEQTALDIEEAARSRDWRAIRTIQRRYALEKKQRKEDYDLQVHQTVESWEARHKENQVNLAEEIKEVQDSLAIELAELEAEKAEELQEIKDNWDERRQELKDQYDQELADLKAALDRRLAEAIAEWADQNNIPVEAVKAAVAAMAALYDQDVDNLTKMTLAELDLLEARRAAWDAVTKAASGELTKAIIIPNLAKAHKTQGFATGGMAIATAPTLVRVGEAGPELFTAIPLARGSSVLGGARGYGGGDFHLSIDGNQTGLWSSDFERGVEHTVAKIFKEAFQE